MKRCLVIAAVIFLAVSSAHAGGPFWVHRLMDLGQAQHWTNNTLEWWIEPEGNDLSATVSNATAKGWIEDALAKWTNAQLLDADLNAVSTVNFTATFGGYVDEGIDETNYLNYDNATLGPTVVIFDRNGMITKDIYGEGYTGVAGLTELLLSDSEGKKLLKGVVILNGVLLSGGSITLSNGQFKAAILHELGHLLNLDHTQVNLESADNCDLTAGVNIDPAGCPDSQFIPTMFPALKTWRQGEDLNIDDIATMSWIYPSSAFNSSFCTITGEIQDENGRPLQGVNVIARRVGEGEIFTKGDSRSMVSGVMYPACYNDGHYYLYGIVPGRTYEVIYEPLASAYTGVSGFEPLDEPPDGFDTGTIGTAKCDEGGQTVEMDAVKISGVDVGTVKENNGCATDSGGDGGGAASSGCTLIYAKANEAN